VQQRRSHLVLIGLIVAALVGALLVALPGSPLHRSPTLGLDLQGGLEVVLEAVPPKGQKVTRDGLDRSVDIMRNRVDKLGVSEPDVREQPPNQIVIQLPGVNDPAKAARIIGQTARLELYDLESDLTGPSIDAQGFPVATPSLNDLLAGQQAKAKKGTPSAYYLFGKNRQLLAGPSPTREGLFARQHPRVPPGGKVLAVPENTVVITCDDSAAICPGLGGPPPPGRTVYYLFKHDPTNADPEKRIPEMTGEDLKLSGTQADLDPQTGQPIVLMRFTGQGERKFHDVTRAEAVRGRLLHSRIGGDADNSNQHFAIVLDRELKSFPSIDFQQYPDGIDPTNGAQITGLGSSGEAKDLALVLQTGALPYDYRIVSRSDVSATLGKDSLQEAKTAAAAGLIVVAIFLLVLYRFLGLVAVIGLGIYVAFLYGALLLLNVTLTLPGFAGLILTIGVAADANVVIFERIKEEYRAGKSVKAAIAAGYSKGFHTIIDANVVTAITAVVLFAVATAQVRGFALMLLVGTVISLVTAVAATRAMLGLLGGFRWFDNPHFMGAAAIQRGKWLQIDFMKRRYLWFTISGVIVAVSIASLAVRGLNLGIDFKGGTQITFKTPEPTSLESVRSQACDIGRCDAVIQGRGSSSAGKYSNFSVRTRSLSAADQDKLTGDLEQRLDAQSVGVKNVSSSFGKQIRNSAIWAIVVSLFLIMLYIAVRFDYKFALPVIVALAHDLVVTVGIYSLSGREVSTATVAAVLTVLGYSIYDTIIIFDRIRENIPLMRRASFATIANVSLWETIRRSLATTFITLLPVTCLLLFGGDTLKDFAFALLIGIGSGAYSSIFIAAPLLTMWKEREPEYRRRIGSDVVERGVGDAVLEEAEKAAAAEPAPEVPLLPPVPAASTPAAPAPAPAPTPTPAPAGDGKPADSKREQRRQRRRSRPHGRAR
jgi:SecD/SecF fusion protein